MFFRKLCIVVMGISIFVSLFAGILLAEGKEQAADNYLSEDLNKNVARNEELMPDMGEEISQDAGPDVGEEIGDQISEESMLGRSSQ